MKILRIALLFFCLLCLFAADMQAQLILSSRVSIYDPVDIFSGKESAGWGAIVDGDTILKPKYKNIDLLGSNHLLLAVQDKKKKTYLYGVSDLKGRMVLECIYKDIAEIYSNANLEAELEKDITRVVKDERAYTTVEQMPSFPGGEMEMMKYIFKNLKYPEKECEEFGLQTRITARFVIDIDGSTQEIEVLRGICAALDDEVIRMVRNMPKWEAGMQDGKAVPVYFTLPIHFSPSRSR